MALLKPAPAAIPRGLTFFAALGSFMLLGALLIFAKAVLVPVALAVLLTFLLGPMVVRLQRAGLNKVVAVLLVVITAFVLIGGVGYVMYQQLDSLASRVATPETRHNIMSKIADAKERWSHSDSAVGDLATLFQDIKTQIMDDVPLPPAPEPPEFLKRPTASPTNGNLTPDDPSGDDPEKEPVKVVVEAQEDEQLAENITRLGDVLIEPLANAGLVVVLVVFMLLKREDLRNRVVTLSGRTHLAVTTKAVDEAALKIGRFLLVQFGINMGYGIVFAMGLLALRVEYALLWGFSAAVLRYIPFIGAWIAAVLPIGYTVLESTGWTQPVGVVVLILVLELIVNNVVEPLLYGRNVGVSEVAIILSAVVWGWLWGAIGLVLATPMTVCLVVAGRYVPALSFLDRLLGDNPEVDPHIVYYQRLLAKDDDEAEELFDAYVLKHSLADACGEVVVPALENMKRDRMRNMIDDGQESFILESIQEHLEELPTAGSDAKPVVGMPASALPLIFGYGVRDATDEAGVAVLARLCDDAPCRFETLSRKMLFSEIVAAVREQKPAGIVLLAIPPGGVTHTRGLCKRLRTAAPGLKIIVGRWAKTLSEKHRAALREQGAAYIGRTPAETRECVVSVARLTPVAETISEPVAVA